MHEPALWLAPQADPTAISGMHFPQSGCAGSVVSNEQFRLAHWNAKRQGSPVARDPATAQLGNLVTSSQRTDFHTSAQARASWMVQLAPGANRRSGHSCAAPMQNSS